MAKQKFGLVVAKVAGYKAASKLLKTDTPLTEAYYKAMFVQFMEGVREAKAEFEDWQQETGNTFKSPYDC